MGATTICVAPTFFISYSISLFRHRSEAQGELMSSCWSHVLWQTRITTTAAVTNATLPEIEVSENLVRAYQVVRMLATIEYVVVELGIIEVRQREGYHALGGNLQLRAVVVQCQLAQALAVAHGLRSTLLFEHAIHGGLVQT